MSSPSTPPFAPIRKMLLGVFVIVGCFAATNAGAGTVYNNGPLYHPAFPQHADGYEMTVSFTADDFTLNSAARIESVKFWDLEASGGFGGSIAWRIYANGADNTPGVMLYSGNSTDVIHSATGYVDAPVVEYVNTFVIAPISLPAGTYWLALHNGSITNGTNRFFYWEKADSNGARASQTDFGPPFLDTWWTNAAPNSPLAELSFQLTGTPAPTTTALIRTGGIPRISFIAEQGSYYRAEYKNNIGDSQWLPVAGATNIAGTGSTVQVMDTDPSVGTQPRRVYRIVLQ